MYDKPIEITYPINAGSVTADADLLTVSGPNGLKGKITAVSTVVTTGVTVAASTVEVGTSGDNDAYASLVIPVSSAGAVANNVTINTNDDNLIAADSAVVIGSGGGATAGACNIFVTIAWF
jgi:hypothetical protein